MSARKIPNRLNSEEKQLLPIALDAAAAFLFACENEIDVMQLHAAIVAALSTFKSVLMNGGLYEQGYHAALNVSKSLPDSVDGATRLLPKRSKDSKEKLIKKMDIITTMLGETAKNSLTGVSPQLKHNVGQDVKTFMKLYSLLPFKKKEKLYGHGDEVVPMEDSDYELNVQWLEPNAQLEGGGFTDWIGSWFRSNKSSNNSDLPPELASMATNDTSTLTDVSAPLPQSSSSTAIVAEPEIPGTSRLSFAARELPAIFRIGKETFNFVHKFNKQVLNPWAARPTEREEGFWGGVKSGVNSALKWAYRNTAGRANIALENMYENNPDLKRFFEDKDTGDAVRRLGTVLEQGIPAIAKDYALLQQKKRAYYQQLAQHRADKKALQNQALLEKENAEREARNKNRNIAAKNASDVAKQKKEHQEVDEYNKKVDEEYGKKKEQWDNTMAILNAGTKNAKVKADAAIRLMIASELAETADERRAIRHEVVGAIKDVGSILDSTIHHVARQNVEVGSLIGDAAASYNNIMYDLPEAFEKNDKKKQFLTEMKEAFDKLTAMEYLAENQAENSAWFQQQQQQHRQDALDVTKLIFGWQQRPLNDEEIDKLHSYAERIKTGEVPSLTELAAAYVPTIREGDEDVIGVADWNPNHEAEVLFTPGFRNERAQQNREELFRKVEKLDQLIANYDPSLIDASNKFRKSFRELQKDVPSAAIMINNIATGQDALDRFPTEEEYGTTRLRQYDVLNFPEKQREAEYGSTRLRQHDILKFPKMQWGVKVDYNNPEYGEDTATTKRRITAPYSFKEDMVDPLENVKRFLNEGFSPSVASKEQLERARMEYEHYATHNPYFRYIPRATDLFKKPKEPTKPQYKIKSEAYVTDAQGRYFNPETGEYYDDRLRKPVEEKRVLSYEERLAAMKPEPAMPTNIYETPYTDKFLQEMRKQEKEEKVKPLHIPKLSDLFSVDKDYVTPVSSGKKGKSKMLTTLVVPAYRNPRRITTAPLQGLTAMRFGRPSTRFKVFPQTVSKTSSVGAVPSPLITLPKTSRIRPWR